MTLSSTVTLEWADGEYSFTLRLRELEELQRLTGVGFGALVNRVLNGEFHVRDVLETIRLGLIGGGTEPIRAKQLVATYAEGHPFLVPGDPSSPLLLAQTIILAAYSGIPSEDDAPEGEQKAGTTDGSTSRLSKQLRSKPASRRSKSAG